MPSGAPGQPAPVKVLVRDPEGDPEELWAMPLGGDAYRLDNTPFFAYSLSWLDVIIAPKNRRGIPVFARIERKSGNRTVRVASESDAYVPKELIRRLESLGCTYEGIDPTYLAFNVPPSTSLGDVVAVLESVNPEEFTWEHADPTYEELEGEAPDAPASARGPAIRESSKGTDAKTGNAKSSDVGRNIGRDRSPDAADQSGGRRSTRRGGDDRRGTSGKRTSG
ncbi:MAG: DUF4265 domain-containing protein [Planctomycetota bacterium]|nr:DUF4265 domain-containing protein [Planctomycetota bacterium]